VTIAERAAHAATILREQNLVPSTRLHEVKALIAAALEMTEFPAVRELEARLKRAEDVCYAVQEANATTTVHLKVAKALKAWQKGLCK